MDIQRLCRIHKLIQQEATGTPDEMAVHFNVKKRQLQNLLEEMRDYGANICYDRKKRTYYYADDFEIDTNLLSGKGQKDFLQEILKKFIRQ